MLLGDFIKELKHNSTWITLLHDNMDLSPDYRFLLEGTLGVIKNNIHYQNEYSKWIIACIQTRYDEKMKCEFVIWLYKREGE